MSDKSSGSKPAKLPRVQPIEYAIPVKALSKWMRFNLGCMADPDGSFHYTFQLMGSTCSNGGIPINATLHAIVRDQPAGAIVENAWIEIPTEDRGLKNMCEYVQRGADFVAQLRRSPDFCGQSLEAILSRPLAINPAGCFCKPPQANHKWRQMLSTIHYALSQAHAGAETD